MMNSRWCILAGGLMGYLLDRFRLVRPGALRPLMRCPRDIACLGGASPHWEWMLGVRGGPMRRTDS